MRQALSFASPVALLLGALLMGGVLAGCSSAGSDDDAGDAPAQQQATADSVAPDSATATPPTATDQGRTVAERVEDAALAARVKTALTENRQLRTFEFDPSVTDGRVTLTGDVSARGQGRTAAEVASEVEGVDDVLNRLTVSGQQVAWNAGSENDEQQNGSQQVAASGPSGGSSSSGSSSGGAAVADAGEQGAGTSGGNASGNGNASEGGAGSGAADEAAEEETEYHVVEQGESLWAIAQENGLSVARLKELNSLSGDGLMPGDRLRVE